MLFHSSFRKELARSFGATLVVLVTVVMTMTLIRTLGEASRGVFNPADVMLVMGYTVLADMTSILSMSLFLAVLGVVTRMYRDSEMVIWFGSGRGLGTLLLPLLRFAWPIVLVNAALALLILPWTFSRIEDMRDRYQKRGDIARIQPGQFQESASGDRVFFIEQDSSGLQAGLNVFIATQERGKETLTSARSGRLQTIGQERFLVLENGQRLEKNRDNNELSVGVFNRYGAIVAADDQSARIFVPNHAKSTWDLLAQPTVSHQAELSWRIGLALATINFVVIGLGTAGTNPRVGRSAGLVFAFMAFIVYFNLLVLGKTWIATAQVSFALFLLALHGGTLALAVLWLLRRHNHWSLRHWLAQKGRA